MKRVVVSPSQLITWRKIDEATFEGVIASNVQRSYRELARREAVYYAIPGQLQAEQQWRIEAPEEEKALPKTKKLNYEQPEWMKIRGYGNIVQKDPEPSQEGVSWLDDEVLE